VFGDYHDNDLTITVGQDGGFGIYNALPGWLSWEAPVRMLYGTPNAFNVGNYNLKAKAADRYGRESSDVYFQLIVQDNNVPTIRAGYSIGTITVYNGVQFSY